MGKGRRRSKKSGQNQQAEAVAYRPPLWEDVKLFGGFAIVFLAMIVVHAPVYVATTRAAADMLSELRSIPDASGQKAGTRAALSGVVVSDTNPPFGPFVAYVEETYERGGGRVGIGSWSRTGGELQRLQVRSDSGPMWIANTDYPLQPSASWWSDPVPSVWFHLEERQGDPEGRASPLIRYRGFVAGRAVTAVGTVTEQGYLKARYVVSGTRQEVEQDLSDIAAGKHNRVAFWFTALGSTGLFMCVVFFIRARMTRQ